jgi:aspartate/methionine/tyrosine aminotransferase
MGNPDLPAPAHGIEKLKDTLGKATHRPLFGLQGHCRPAPRAGGLLLGRRFGVKLNPETQVVATLGSRKVLPTWRRPLRRLAMWCWCLTRATRSTPSAF